MKWLDYGIRPDQEFKLEQIRRTVPKLSREQLEDNLLGMMRILFIKENVLAQLLKEEAKHG